MAGNDSTVTIGFSTHRIEVIPFMRREMEDHDITVLEEPPNQEFAEMLEGNIAVDDYLLGVDSQFPLFDRAMCMELKHQRRMGKTILQVEPYLEMLIEIHELFAAGKTPEDILPMPGLREVYLAEKNATGSLIAFYSASRTEAFPNVVDAVKRFARADAGRLLLRERLRAQAISSLATGGPSLFIEAGYIHYPLFIFLRRMPGNIRQIRVRFLLESAVRRHKGKRRNLGPGDLLTLHYSLHGNIEESLGDLLAARSLIYVRLIDKEELVAGEEEAPHSLDEARVNRLVDRLTFNDCARLYQALQSEPALDPWIVVSRDPGFEGWKRD